MNSIYPLNDTDTEEEDSGVQVTLGLRREPFAPEPAREFFYAEQTRSQRLKLLHHLAPYGELLLVTGETGSGKTTLMQQFVERAHDTWRLCMISAHRELAQGQLLDALLEGFAVQTRPAAGEADKLQALKSHCVALKRKGLLPMVVIDDAHLLAPGALAVLMQLLQSLDSHEKPLRIVLFAAPPLRENLAAPELEGLQERVTHTFNLPPFSEKETANYIQHRLKVAGAGGGELFTDTVVTMIHKASQGQPGKINELAKVVLANNSAGAALEGVPGAERGRAAGRTKGWKNVLPLGLALTIFILVVLYLLQNVGAPPPAGKTEQAPIARNGDQETVPLALPTDTAPAGPENTAAGAEDQGGAPPSLAGDQSPGAAPEAPSAAGSADGGGAPPPESPASPPTPSAVTAPPPEQAPAAHPAASPAPAASGAAHEAPAPKLAHVEPPAKVAAVPAAAGVRDADWVLGQNPQHFTMQVMATHTPASIDRFVHGRGLKAGDFAQFQKVSGGKRWHVLIYGSYASRGQAEARSRHLPAALRGVKPWIRPFADVQATIRQYRRAHP